MPGIVGFTKGNRTNCINILKKMQCSITHYDYYRKGKMFCDEYVCATGSYINTMQGDQPHIHSGVYVWLDGEFFNSNELREVFLECSNYDTDAEILIRLYKNYSDFSFLRKIDGLYSAIIYDKNKGKVYLITDRYGLRHLYFMIYNGQLYWSSEVKSMLEIPGFGPKINNETLSEFFALGYPLENRTWFEQVELLPSGTVTTWNLKTCTLEQNQYWWWNEIKPFKGNIDENEIVEELGNRFVQAVEKRSEGRIGLTLSGGLDSRAILAAMPKYTDFIHAVTFGKRHSADVQLARRAAYVKGAKHHTVELSGVNWIEPRFQGVWWTDGQLDLMHMHGIEAKSIIANYMDINLNGFAGDAILGGSCLINDRTSDIVSTEDIRKLFSYTSTADFDVISHLYLKQYKTLTKPDYVFLQNRVRRFTFSGTKIGLVTTEQRKPFYDNNLIEFIYSLPDTFRYKSYIYKKMLLRYFPLFFEKIPWQKTGVPISWSTDKVNRNLNLIQNLKSNKTSNYTDYPAWIKQKPAKFIFEEILLNNKNALYENFISKEKVLREWQAHINNEKVYSINLCRYLTFEIWLQQVYEKKYREGLSAL